MEDVKLPLSPLKSAASNSFAHSSGGETDNKSAASGGTSTQQQQVGNSAVVQDANSSSTTFNSTDILHDSNTVDQSDFKSVPSLLNVMADTFLETVSQASQLLIQGVSFLWQCRHVLSLLFLLFLVVNMVIINARIQSSLSVMESRFNEKQRSLARTSKLLFDIVEDPSRARNKHAGIATLEQDDFRR